MVAYDLGIYPQLHVIAALSADRGEGVGEDWHGAAGRSRAC